MPILTINTGIKVLLDLSIEGSLILDRLEYWWKKMKRPFYKYLSPVSGKTYGDSWVEETTLTRHRFNKAFQEIGKKYSSVTDYINTPDDLKFVEDGDEKLYASVFCRRTNQTYYYRNTKKILSILDSIGETSKQYLRDDDQLTDVEEVEDVEVDVKPNTSLETQQEDNSYLTEQEAGADDDFLDLTGVSFTKASSKTSSKVSKSEETKITPVGESSQSVDSSSNEILDIELFDINSNTNETETQQDVDADSYVDDILDDNSKPLFLSQKEEMAFYLFLRDIQMISNQKLNIGRASTFAGSDLNQLKSRNSKKPRYWNVVSYYRLWVSRGRNMTFEETQAYINTSYKDYKSSIESEKLHKISEEALLENGKYDMNKLVL
jgi:hypothetical protein